MTYAEFVAAYPEFVSQTFAESVECLPAGATTLPVGYLGVCEVVDGYPVNRPPAPADRSDALWFFIDASDNSPQFASYTDFCGNYCLVTSLVL